MKVLDLSNVKTPGNSLAGSDSSGDSGGSSYIFDSTSPDYPLSIEETFKQILYTNGFAGSGKNSDLYVVEQLLVQDQVFNNLCIEKMYFKGIQFKDCTFIDCNFDRCVFDNTVFRNCNLEGSRIYTTKLDRLKLITSVTYNTCWDYCWFNSLENMYSMVEPEDIYILKKIIDTDYPEFPMEFENIILNPYNLESLYVRDKDTYCYNSLVPFILDSEPKGRYLEVRYGSSLAAMLVYCSKLKVLQALPFTVPVSKLK